MAAVVTYDTTTGVILAVNHGDAGMVKYIPSPQPGEAVVYCPDHALISQEPDRYMEFLVDLDEPENPLLTKQQITPTASPNPFKSNDIEACRLSFPGITTKISVQIGSETVEVLQTDTDVDYYTNIPGFLEVHIVNDPVYWFPSFTIEAR